LSAGYKLPVIKYVMWSLMIEFYNVHTKIDNKTILNDITFRILKGEFVFLTGSSGAGKSTILRHIYMDLFPEKGMVIVENFSSAKIKEKDIPILRRKLGVIFQDFKLLIDRTVDSNLEFALKATGWKDKEEIKDRIAEVLEKVDLGYKGYKMPHQLSGGEQQRVVIARALLNEPEIILADEPTGNLDPATSKDIMEILMEISQGGKAVMMATHNYNLIKKFPSRTLKCEGGKLVGANLSEAEFDRLIQNE